VALIAIPTIVVAACRSGSPDEGRAQTSGVGKVAETSGSAANPNGPGFFMKDIPGDQFAPIEQDPAGGKLHLVRVGSLSYDIFYEVGQKKLHVPLRNAAFPINPIAGGRIDDKNRLVICNTGIRSMSPMIDGDVQTTCALVNMTDGTIVSGETKSGTWLRSFASTSSGSVQVRLTPRLNPVFIPDTDGGDCVALDLDRQAGRFASHPEAVFCVAERDPGQPCWSSQLPGPKGQHNGIRNTKGQCAPKT